MKKTILFSVLALLCLFFKVSAQTRTIIQGTVIDSVSNEPVSGAVISLIGYNIKTVTDPDGQFKIISPVSNGAFTVRFIGYRTAIINFGGSSTGHITVRLCSAQNTLSEVSIVSTGYQLIPKERSTGSFVQIDSTLINRRVSTDIISRLEGIVPGLLFNRNTLNAANGTPDLSIRGHSTLFSNDQPLVVVDNFPYDGDINNINPNDVASITVLKDAAAASIWGVRSGNGVIVITTKKGKPNQKLTIAFNTNLTIGNKPDVKYDPNFLDAADFINVEQTLFKTGFYDSDLNYGFPAVTPVIQLLAEQRAGTISAANAASQIDALKQVDVRNDIEKYFYRKSADQQYDLNFRGGGNKSDYYVSLGYDNNLANLTGNSNNRVTINTSYNFYPIRNLQFTLGVNYTRNNGKDNSTLSDLNPSGKTIYPYAQFASPNGNPLPVVKNYSQSFVNDPANAQYLDWNYRPLDELKNADNNTSSFDNRINTGVKYSFLKGFSIEGKYSFENTQTSTNNYFSQSTYYTRNLINTYTQQNPDGTLSYPVPLGGILTQTDGSLVSHHVRGQLNYSAAWNKSSFAAIAGSELSSAINTVDYQAPAFGYNKETGSSNSSIDYLDYYGFYPRGSGSGQVPHSQNFGKLTDHYLSYFANAAYTYNDKYTLSASGRVDESNLFGVNINQKAVPLYSAGIAWDLSKEDFYNLKWLPGAKLRATYGYNGNVNKTATAVTTIIQQGNGFYTGVPYAAIANPGNPDLEWEKDRMINLGLDFNTKDQVFSGSVEFYFKKGINLFGNESLPPSTGNALFFGNNSGTAGHGIDLVLNSHTIYHEKFRWLTSFLYSHAVDKVTQYNVQSTTSNYLTTGSGNGGTITPLVGAPVFGIYSYRSGPLTHDAGDPQGYLDGQLSTDYSAILRNTTISGLLFNGSARPTSYGSLRNTFIYKAWSLSFNAIYKFGYYFRRSSISYGSLYTYWQGNKDFEKRWLAPGDELKTNVPSMQAPPVDQNRDFFYTYSQSLVDKGDHIRLQDITVDYDLTKSVWKKSPFTNLSLYAYINNVGILWRANHDGLDPDVYSAAGVTSLPIPRTYSIGIKSNFK